MWSARLQILVVELAVLQSDATVGENENAVGTVAELELGPEPGQIEEQLDVPALGVLLQREVLRGPSGHHRPPLFTHVSRKGTIRLNTGSPCFESLESAT